MARALKLSPTVDAVLGELSSAGEVTSWQIVKEILTRHPEFGEGRAREVASGPEPPPPGVSKSAQAWLDEVASLFDPVLVPRLHGRVVILGLCLLDPALSRHLRGFGAELEKELREDFYSLLLAEHADSQRYKHDFLVTLQNRGKSERTDGFVFVVTGGPGLESLEQLCFRQQYNYCFTARYVMPAGSKLGDFLNALVADLRGLARQDTNAVGVFLPEGTRLAGTPEPASWIEVARKSILALDSITDGAPNAEILELLFSEWQEILAVGKRLLLFVEWRGLPDNATAEGLGFDDDVLDHLNSVPERVGVVVSGLPAGVTSRIGVETLELPADLALTRGQPIANDVPEGPDRLDISEEVGALGEAVALEEMRPPLVVGILGGWGAGKSFVLHLLEERLHEIRCERIEEGQEDRFPFIGHPYVIRFDAWTFAKSDLWASLMQTILAELDRQLTLEHALSEDLGLDLRKSTEVWRLLGHLSERQTERLLKTELGRKALDTVARLQAKGTSGKLWTELNALLGQATADLAKEERDLLALQAEVSTARLELESSIDDAMAQDARRAAWAPFWQQVQALVAGKFAETDAPTYQQVVDAISLPRKFLLGLKHLSLPAAAFALLALVGGGALAFLTPLSEWIGAGVGALVAAMAPLARGYDWLQTLHKEYDEGLVKAQKTKAVTRDQRVEEALAHARQEVAAEKVAELEGRGAPAETVAERESQGTPAERVVELERQARSKEAEVRRLRERAGISRHSDLRDFVKARLEGGAYEQNLGLLHQIQGDFSELSETLLPSRARGALESTALAKLFPRGTPRVILLIDDLDRCPPEKVVEVLEAAQLLVKTPLFVVVVAMDVRYVTRALEAKYEGVLVRNGEPSGLDYIEKIIQVPYRVRTTSAMAIRSFLRHQMAPADVGGGEEAAEQEAAVGAVPPIEPPEKDKEKDKEKNNDDGSGSPVPAARTELRVLPTKVLSFEPYEHALISASCSAIDVSPRAMKRLVNVFKLLKIIWYRRGLAEGPEQEVKQAMLSLLVLAARYPEVMRRLLAVMEAAYRGPSSPGGEVLADFLIMECERGAVRAIYPPDWESVGSALRDEEFFPSQIRFSEFEETNLHLVSSFSFVGETDSEREAALKHGYYGRAPSWRGSALPSNPEPWAGVDTQGPASVPLPFVD